MSLDGNLIHTCTIEKPSVVEDAYGNQTRQYGPHYLGVPCRLVERTQRIARDEKTDLLPVTTLTLLLGPDADVQPEDRITDIGLDDGTLDVRTFVIRSVNTKRAGRGPHHKSAALEVLGAHRNAPDA